MKGIFNSLYCYYGSLLHYNDGYYLFTNVLAFDTIIV